MYILMCALYIQAMLPLEQLKRWNGHGLVFKSAAKPLLPGVYEPSVAFVGVSTSIGPC